MSDVQPYILVALAVSMAYTSGANDGGAILALPARIAEKGITGYVVTLVTAVFLGPLLLTSVATTLVEGLFDFDGANGSTVFMLGTIAGLLLVIVLNRSGLPTSLTLALVGGLTGAGLGAGALVDAAMVGRVLLIGLAAPTLGFALAVLGFKLIEMAGGLTDRSAVMKPLTRTSFGMLSLAYAINDGQKMIAIAAVAVLSLRPDLQVLGAGHWWARMWVSAILVAIFSMGVFTRIRQVGFRLGLGLARVRGTEVLVAQGAAAVAVLASSAAGAPVSMTQAISGGIVGSSVPKGMHRVRWVAVAKILGAWVITLPGTFGAGYGLGLLI